MITAPMTAAPTMPIRRRRSRCSPSSGTSPRTIPVGHGSGVYHAEIHGPIGQRVQIILLDTRTFRAPLEPTNDWNAPGKERYMPDPDPAKTMLGEAQWRWLRAQLEQPAELRLIVSSVQVLAEGHGFERWGNLPLERQKLFDLIAESGASDVVFLSGDRHFGALYHRPGTARRTRSTRSPRAASTWSTKPPWSPVRSASATSIVPKTSAASKSIGPSEQATLSVRGMDGAPVRQTVIPITAPE